MTALLHEARAAGIALEAEGEQLRWQAPKQAAAHWLPILRERKTELLHELWLESLTPQSLAKAIQEEGALPLLGRLAEELANLGAPTNAWYATEEGLKEALEERLAIQEHEGGIEGRPGQRIAKAGLCLALELAAKLQEAKRKRLH